MRHLQKGRKLNRSTPHRIALLRNMACELFVRERIKTTVAKAKELRPYAEKLITLARHGAAHLDSAAGDTSKTDRAKALHVRRLLMQRLGGKRRVVVKEGKNMVQVNVADKLMNDLGPRYQTRPGGYTRIVKLAARRLGDAAPVAIIELMPASR